MRSTRAYPLVVALMVGVLLLLSVFLLVFFGISGGSVSTQEEPATASVLVGAGDIAKCDGTGDEATANLIDNIDGTVVTLGDNAYPNGTDAEFANCYEPSWGRHKARTMPSPGNHEYLTAGASGYFGYFGAAAGDPQKGYYAYDLANWRIYALNSMCQKVGGCEASAPMVTWLKDDLAAHPSTCTAAYFHHSLFSSGAHGNQTKMKPTWDALYQAGADVVLSSHDHNYERFAPQNPSGQADPDQGIREFVVGTGGGALRAFKSIQPNSEVRIADVFGVIKLTLHPEGYDWQFVTAPDGTVADSGSGQCHGAPPPSPPPPDDDTTAPTVISTVPEANATGVDPTANLTATFSEDMDASTINGQTFKLFKKGSTTKLAAAVSYDAGTDTATLNPDRDLTRGVTYKAVVSTGTKDLAGNPLDQNSTKTGSQQHKWFFTVSN